MSDMNYHGIRLFGKVIPLGPNSDEDIAKHNHTDCDYGSISSDQGSKQSKNRGAKKFLKPESKDISQESESTLSSVSKESKTLASLSTSSEVKDCSSQDLCNKENSSDQTSSSSLKDQNSPLKKPDKILPCPRCNSMSTKFCYFNNYNVNQPRHFCRACQRYWTAGGTMRSVPVGAGRRKSKSSSSSASQYHHLVTSEASDGVIHFGRRTNETVQSSGEGSSPSEFEASMNSNSLFVKRIYGTSQGLQPQVPVLQGSPATYDWNSTSWQSGYPVAFYAAPSQWNSTSTGNLNSQSQATQSDRSSPCSSHDSHSPRKHSRDGTLLLFGLSDSDDRDLTEAENSRVVRQKTSRIDNPVETANTSIWSTLRSTSNKHVISPFGNGGFFGGARQYYGNVHDMSDSSTKVPSRALHFNPAASSRSLLFHEIAQ